MTGPWIAPVFDCTEQADRMADWEGYKPGAFAATHWQDASALLGASARLYSVVFASLGTRATGMAVAVRYAGLQERLRHLEDLGTSTTARGNALEDVVEGLAELTNGALTVLEKRVKHSDEELDLVLQNNVAAPFWTALASPLIIVECKNWSGKVGIPELRVLESKISDRGRMCNVGVLVALHGVTREVVRRLRALQSNDVTIFVLDGGDLRSMVVNQTPLQDYLADAGVRKLL